MRQTRLFHYLLIAFVLLAYQSNTLHFEHLLEKNDDCHTCIVEEHTENVLHEISHVLAIHLSESIVENSAARQKISRPDIRKIVQTPARESVDLSGLNAYCSSFIPLGYLSHAPPFSLS